jgi:hypothetical protein
MIMNSKEIEKRNQAVMVRILPTLKKKYKVHYATRYVIILSLKGKQDIIEIDMHSTKEKGFNITLWIDGISMHRDDARGISEGWLIPMIDDIIALYNMQFYHYQRQMSDRRRDDLFPDDEVKTYTWYGKPKEQDPSLPTTILRYVFPDKS